MKMIIHCRSEAGKPHHLTLNIRGFGRKQHDSLGSRAQKATFCHPIDQSSLRQSG